MLEARLGDDIPSCSTRQQTADDGYWEGEKYKMQLGDRPQPPEMEYNRAGFDTIVFIPANQIDDLCKKLLKKDPIDVKSYGGCTYQYPMDIHKIVNKEKFYRGPSKTLLSEKWVNNGLHEILAHENDHQKIRSLIQWIGLDLERRSLPPFVIEDAIPYFRKQLEDIDEILDTDDYIDDAKTNIPKMVRFANIDHLIAKCFEEYVNYITEQEIKWAEYLDY